MIDCQYCAKAAIAWTAGGIAIDGNQVKNVVIIVAQRIWNEGHSRMIDMIEPRSIETTFRRQLTLQLFRRGIQAVLIQLLSSWSRGIS